MVEIVGGLNRKIRGVAALLAAAMKLGMHLEGLWGIKNPSRQNL